MRYIRVTLLCLCLGLSAYTGSSAQLSPTNNGPSAKLARLGSNTRAATGLVPAQVAGISDVVAVSTAGVDPLGQTFNAMEGAGALAVRSDGTVWQLSGVAAPVRVSGLTDVAAVAMGLERNIALKRDGTVWQWSPDLPNLRRGVPPFQVTGPSGVVSIAVGTRSVAVTNDGTVWEWYLDSSPVAVGPGGMVMAAPAGNEIGWGNEILLSLTVGLKADGTVWRWSWGQWAGTDLGTAEGRVEGLADIVAIAGTSVALKKDGTVWQFNPEAGPPAQINGLSGIVAISIDPINSLHGLALKNDGTVWAWGNNDVGQLGDGTTTHRTSAVRVLGLQDVIAISAADVVNMYRGSMSLALKRDGSVWAWGCNLASRTEAGTPLPAQISSGGIVNAASFMPAPDNTASPGALISIFGANLATAPGRSPGLPLLTEINGTRAIIDGKFAPLLFVSSGQINAQIPFEVAASSLPVQVLVMVNGVASASETLKIESVSPGIFSLDASGSGPGVLMHSDNVTLISAAAPAKVGETIVIYCTGLGATDPPALTGNAANGQPTVNIPLVTIGGQIAPVIFSGAVAGFVGLYQVNVIVPSIASGDQPVVIAMPSTGKQSRADVTVCVQ